MNAKERQFFNQLFKTIGIDPSSFKTPTAKQSPYFDAQGKRIGTKYIAHRSDGTEIGSYSRTDKAEDPKTKAIELRTPSKETIEANVSLE